MNVSKKQIISLLPKDHLSIIRAAEKAMCRVIKVTINNHTWEMK